MPQTLPQSIPNTRIKSIDLLRGAVMVLMAIDHVRVYSGIPAGAPDAGIFFTRWVTHFCVSGFVFLAGASAFLYGQKLNNRPAFSRYLLLRGLWLVLLELTVLRFAWSFNVNLTDFILAGVLWMLGWCMVLMAAIIWLPLRVIWIVGVCIIAFQQVFKWVPAEWTWWNFLYPVSEHSPGGINVLYVLVPWIGVMMAGFGFGRLLILAPEKTKQLCHRIGLAAIALFLIAGTVIAIRNPGNRPFIFRLLNQQKYPASQLYLLMTLGPLIALTPLAERATGWIPDILSTIGKVPLFFYLVHIPLIHITALAANAIFYHKVHREWYSFAPYSSVPDTSRWSLGSLYVVYLIDLVILYFLCRWYVAFKQRHKNNKFLQLI
jgi:uncharacterized membrane protein